MEMNSSASHKHCLSLADGFMAQCEIVQKHNYYIGASSDDLIEVPEEMTVEFGKLSSTIEKVRRAYELGLVHE